MKKIITVLFSLLLVLSLGACSKNEEENKTIKVAASSVPHAEILEICKELVAKDGYTLEVKEFPDYVQPIECVESGEFDANYFAHVPYLDNYNQENGSHQVTVAKVHYEPYGLYPSKKTSISELEKGDAIAVPHDPTNETRALLLLQDNGIITLPEGTTAASSVTAKDIVSYGIEGIEIVEVEAASISRLKDDYALFVLNGNYALEAGLNAIKDSIDYEDSSSDAATRYVNVLAVKQGNENNESILALAKALKSDEVKAFIESEYEGAVIFYEGE